MRTKERRMWASECQISMTQAIPITIFMPQAILHFDNDKSNME